MINKNHHSPCQEKAERAPSDQYLMFKGCLPTLWGRTGEVQVALGPFQELVEICITGLEFRRSRLTAHPFLEMRIFLVDGPSELGRQVHKLPSRVWK